MKVTPTDIPDVLLIEPKVFGDHRGFFLETWSAASFREAGLDVQFVQDNHSASTQGTLRGLHYQLPGAQGKLVWVIAGEVFDVAVDLRRHSPTFGHWVGRTLSGESKQQLWVPAGFAHGFYVTSERAEVIYKCTAPYAPQHEHCLRWNDPAIGIEWPLVGTEPPRMSAKDEAAEGLSRVPHFGGSGERHFEGNPPGKPTDVTAPGSPGTSRT